jgi:hypothetical protein
LRRAICKPSLNNKCSGRRHSRRLRTYIRYAQAWRGAMPALHCSFGSEAQRCCARAWRCHAPTRYVQFVFSRWSRPGTAGILPALTCYWFGSSGAAVPRHYIMCFGTGQFVWYDASRPGTAASRARLSICNCAHTNYCRRDQVAPFLGRQRASGHADFAPKN